MNLEFRNGDLTLIEVVCGNNDAELISFGRKINQLEMTRGSVFAIRIDDFDLKRYTLCVIKSIFEKITPEQWKEVFSS